MCISLNCFILGYSIHTIFSINLGEKVIINDIEHDIKKLQISHLKKYIFLMKKSKFSIDDSDDMDLWKVDVSEDELINVSTEEDIKKLNGEKMRPLTMLRDNFPDNPQRCKVHIIITASATTTSKCLTSQSFISILFNTRMSCLSCCLSQCYLFNNIEYSRLLFTKKACKRYVMTRDAIRDPQIRIICSSIDLFIHNNIKIEKNYFKKIKEYC